MYVHNTGGTMAYEADIVFTTGGPDGLSILSASTERGREHLIHYVRGFSGEPVHMDPKYIEIVALSAQAFGLQTRVDRIGG
jgi:hypothetical protein